MVIICDASDYFSTPQHGPYQNGTGDYGGFDLPNMMKSMTKYTTLAGNASEFLHGIQLAIKHATTGRPGPAAVIIKWNVAFEMADINAISPKVYPIGGYLNTKPACMAKEDGERIAEMLLAAENPVIIAGQGIRMSNAFDELRELAELTGIPVATSYLGKSTIPETHDLALGTMGSIGQNTANARISGADVIFAVGTGLAPENTKYMSPDFINPLKQSIIQVDIDSRNAGWTFPLKMGVTSDARSALRMLIEIIKERGVPYDVQKAIEKVRKEKASLQCFNEEIINSDTCPIEPERVVKEINKVIGEDDILVLDAGNCRMWFTHHFQSKKAGQVIAGGGVAAMGYAPLGAMSAQMVHPGKKIIGVSGDGSFMMHLYALEMARDLNLPVTFVVMNNGVLGNVRDFQAPDRRIATDYSQPNFEKIAKGFGVESVRVEKPEDIGPALKKAYDTDAPFMVEIIVNDTPHFRLMS
jgi:acetolactate synthase-1/2/3 large subunit